tara:strand:- start:8826 stop:9899 length:1074 start_codon:yes stop_codon:yes gene_type:complete
MTPIMAIRWFFLILLLSSSGFAAPKCNFLFQRNLDYLHRYESHYLRFKEEYQRLGLEKAEARLVEDIHQSDKAFFHTIAFLDAFTSQPLYYKLDQQIKLQDGHRAFWQKFLPQKRPGIKIKGQRLLVQEMTSLKDANAVEQYIKSVLEAYYELQLKRSKIKLFTFRHKQKLENIVQNDRFFYDNIEVYGRYMPLKEREYKSFLPDFFIFRIFDFIFSGSPIQKHRLNKNDYNLPREELAKALEKRMLREMYLVSGTKKVLVASIILPLITLPPYLITKGEPTIRVIEEINTQQRREDINYGEAFRERYQASLQYKIKKMESELERAEYQHDIDFLNRELQQAKEMLEASYKNNPPQT